MIGVVLGNDLRAWMEQSVSVPRTRVGSTDARIHKNPRHRACKLLWCSGHNVVDVGCGDSAVFRLQSTFMGIIWSISLLSVSAWWGTMAAMLIDFWTDYFTSTMKVYGPIEAWFMGGVGGQYFFRLSTAFWDGEWRMEVCSSVILPGRHLKYSRIYRR